VPTTTAVLPADVLERSGNPRRDGHFVQTFLTRVSAAQMALEPNFHPTFNGDMWASPLFMQNGPGGSGAFFVVTTTNDVYAFDEFTGAQLWTRNVGQPAMLNGPNAPCGSIHPLGIIATPVIDAQARTIFLAAAVGSATAIERQEVHALSVDDGTERPGWPIDVAARFGFDPQPANPRSALSLVNGIVYVAYGGHFGDCGLYQGRVIAIDSTDPTNAAMWVTGGLGEAVWAPGGMPSDGNGVIAVTGNRHMGSGAHQDSEQVTRVTGMAVVNRTDDDIFYPANWQTMDAMDLDLGCNNAILVDVPGAKPSNLVVSISKDGHFYVLDRAHFGGLAGQLVDFKVAAPAMSISTAPTAYKTPLGVRVAFTVTGMSVGCPSGGGSSMVLSVLLRPGAPTKPVLAWCAPIAGDGAVITTSTTGMNESIVWYMSGDKQATLQGVDGDTGKPVFTGTEACGVIQKWTSPIAVNGRIIVGASGRLCSYSAP
jgi:outer membrane protein assembly factor BamB